MLLDAIDGGYVQPDGSFCVQHIRAKGWCAFDFIRLKHFLLSFNPILLKKGHQISPPRDPNVTSILP